ncbi:MAG: DUF4292 domain-containing protein [Cytophagaceae bacterium]
MNNYFFTFLIFSVTCFICSCQKPKTTTPIPDARREEIEKFIVKEISFNYFSSKAKINFKDDKEDVNATVNIRMKKDSVIWMSVTPGLGIEALRILIRPDSIFMLDKIKNPNVYSAYGFNYLNEKFSIDLNFQNLQAMIVGNLPTPKSYNDLLTKNDADGEYILQQKTPTLNMKNHVKMATMKQEKLEMNQSGTENNLTIEYSGFAPLDTFSFAYANKVQVAIKKEATLKNTSITIDHNKADISDKVLNFPFNVPKRYENR